MQIKVVKTIVGWFNVYLVHDPVRPPVTLSPEKLSGFIPSLSPRVKVACLEVNSEVAAELFGRVAA